MLGKPLQATAEASLRCTQEALHPSGEESLHAHTAFEEAAFIIGGVRLKGIKTIA